MTAEIIIEGIKIFVMFFIFGAPFIRKFWFGIFLQCVEARDWRRIQKKRNVMEVKEK